MNCIEKVSYADLSNGNIIRKLKPLLEDGKMHLKPNGKIQMMPDAVMDHDPPWVHARTSPTRQCGLWHHVFFRVFNFIPIGCMECWKVVVRPKTVEQLFQLHFIQKRLDYPSKCGIETRQYVFGNYGGYFYNNSLLEGLERWKEVSDIVHTEIAPDVKVILKRACTEFEKKFPRSSTWRPFDGQKAYEDKLNSIFMKEITGFSQSEEVKADVMAKWIEYAHNIGDETFLKFTDNINIFSVPYQTYHDPGKEVLQV